MFNKVLVANRGAVAARVLRCLQQLGIRSVMVYSEADAQAPYLEEADETYPLGPGPAPQSYLNQDALLQAIRATRADGLHPGYGFLAENATFAARVTATGCRFIGPQARWIELMGHKTQARQLMHRHGLPLCPSTDVLDGNPDILLAQARTIGLPVMVKPANGGGGIGMLPVTDESTLLKTVERARGLARRSFGDEQVYLEKLLTHPRHVELQILADEYGMVQHLFERDCSVQRRHQKVIEEAPAPALDQELLNALSQTTVATLTDIGYDNIGTMEFLYQADVGFSFLEMNTRLQVEHGVTEAITGMDLVAAQIRLAAGARLAEVFPTALRPQGHAMEARIYAEDPKTFFPSPGPLTLFRPPCGDGIRVDTGYREGNLIPPFYDPLIAKVIAHAPSRAQAISRLQEAIEAFAIAGVKTNQAFILRVLQDEAFRAANVHTGLTQRVLSKEA